MTRTTPRLRKILHLSQIVLTDARTFHTIFPYPYETYSALCHPYYLKR
jgi:hypothetical protein